MKKQNAGRVPIWANGYAYVRFTRDKQFRVIARGANHEALNHSEPLKSMQALIGNLSAAAKALGNTGGKSIPVLFEAGTLSTLNLNRVWMIYRLAKGVWVTPPHALRADLAEAPITLEVDSQAAPVMDLFSGFASYLSSVENLPGMLAANDQLFYELAGSYLRANGFAGDVSKDFPKGISYPPQPVKKGRF